MENKLIFRKAKIEELESVLDLFIKRREWLKRKNINLWQSKTFIKSLQKDLIKALTNEEVFILEENNIVIGCVFLQKDPHNDYWLNNNKEGCLYLSRLCVEPDASGRNLGTMILDCSINECHNKGINFIRLDCRADNIHLPKFYSNYGFVETGRKEFPGDADSQLMELCVFKKLEDKKVDQNNVGKSL